MLCGNFGQSTVKIWQFLQKNLILKNFPPENEKIWQVLSRKRQFRALLIEKLV